jgi:hypothetical protein
MIISLLIKFNNLIIKKYKDGFKKLNQQSINYNKINNTLLNLIKKLEKNKLLSLIVKIQEVLILEVDGVMDCISLSKLSMESNPKIKI